MYCAHCEFEIMEACKQFAKFAKLPRLGTKMKRICILHRSDFARILRISIMVKIEKCNGIQQS